MRTAAAAAVAFSAAFGVPAPAEAVEVWVLLDEGVARVEVSAPDGFVLRGDSGETVLEGRGSIVVVQRGARLEAGPTAVEGALWAEAAGGGPVGVLGNRWRGRVFLEPGRRGMRVLNVLDVEEYLRGVVPLEMPHDWPREALRAQAVAARTYALARAWDTSVPYLQRGVADQVYGGADAERPSTDEAVEATAGRVLLHGGALFVSYFHSSCGGHTDAPIDALGKDRPPAHGVPDTYCLDSPHALWTAEVRGTLRSVRVAPGGRMAEVEWNGRRMSGNDFRLAVGATRVRSLRAVVEPARGATRLVGRGWGHGAGLCQWGARGRALAGADHEAILLHYYPGASFGRIAPASTPLPDTAAR